MVQPSAAHSRGVSAIDDVVQRATLACVLTADAAGPLIALIDLNAH